MRTTAVLICVLLQYKAVSGIICWECANALGEKECAKVGRATVCGPEQDMCQIQVRRGGWGKEPMLDKSCKTVTACGSNHFQNLKPAWAFKGDMIQCNTHAPSSVCRCCCGTDLCNHETLTCDKGSSVSHCGTLTSLENGWIKCTRGNNIFSSCEFGCDPRYNLVGASSMSCGIFGKWSHEKPQCLPVTCLHLPETIRFGSMECSQGVELGSRCTYSCDEGYRLHGAETVTCIEMRRRKYGLWSRPSPVCKPLQCPAQDVFNHGIVTCSDENYVGSQCSFQCNTAGGYLLYPPQVPTTTCQSNEQWDVSWPCCTLPCPPFAIMDFIIILDSSSSVGEENWIITKAFVKSFLKDFIVRNDASRYGGFRYNREVDTNSQIFLDEYPESRDGFFNAFDKINYNGNGTQTGKALNYTVDVMLKRGNRADAKDVVLLITDGRSQDDVVIPAQRLRDERVLVYVVPVMPPNGRLDIDQINAIAGRPENVLEDALTGGFEALNDLFAEKITEILCLNPCQNPFHGHDR